MSWLYSYLNDFGKFGECELARVNIDVKLRWQKHFYHSVPNFKGLVRAQNAAIFVSVGFLDLNCMRVAHINSKSMSWWNTTRKCHVNLATFTFVMLYIFIAFHLFTTNVNRIVTVTFNYVNWGNWTCVSLSSMWNAHVIDEVNNWLILFVHEWFIAVNFVSWNLEKLNNFLFMKQHSKIMSIFRAKKKLKFSILFIVV